MAAWAFLAAGSLDGWILSSSAVRSCVWLLSLLSAFVGAEGVSVACGDVGSSRSMGFVSHQGLCRTAWLGESPGCGRCHAHSAHVIASLGVVGVTSGWLCGCCCGGAVLSRGSAVVWACACSLAAAPSTGVALLAAGGVVAASCAAGELGW